MRKLFVIKENLADKITYYHLALFGISLPFDSLYSRVILLSLSIHTLIHLKKPQLARLKDRKILFLTALFGLSLICAVYTINKDQAVSDLTAELAILIFPLFFALTTLDVPRYKNNLLTFFTAGC
ncbi:MAG TPA: hypothetical protein VKR53_08140, partial [Puia sp.]|nr:hypothetical protein [Puia sp.]